MFDVRQYLLNNFHRWPKGLSYSEPYCLDLQTTQISSLVQYTTLQVIQNYLYDLEQVTKNHEDFVSEGKVIASKDIENLAKKFGA